MNENSSSSRSLPFLLFLASFLIRLLFISKGPFDPDALRVVVSAQETLASGHLQFLHGHGYPLLAVLGTVFLAIGNILGWDPFFSANLINVLFSSLMIIPFYGLVERLCSRTTALFSSILLSLNPVVLSNSIFVNSHMPFLFFFFLALLSVIDRKGPARDGNHVLTGIWLGLAGAARVQDLFLGLPAFLLLLSAGPGVPPGRTAFFRKAGAILLVAGGVLLAFYAPVILDRGAGYYNTGFFHFFLLASLQGLFTPHLAISLQYFVTILGAAGIITALGGFAHLLISRRTRSTGYLLAAWVLGPLFFYGNMDMTTPRFFLITMPALCILQAHLLAVNFQSRQIAIKACAITVFLFLAASSFLLIRPVISFRHDHALTPDFARWIGQRTEPNAVIIVGDENSFIRYFGKRETSRQIASDILFTEDQEAIREKLRAYQRTLDDLLRNGTPVYTTDIGIFSNNNGLFYFFLDRFYTLSYVGQAPIDGWHRSCLKLSIRPIRLFRVLPRSPKDAL